MRDFAKMDGKIIFNVISSFIPLFTWKLVLVHVSGVPETERHNICLVIC